jgi:hypothetical protein
VIFAYYAIAIYWIISGTWTILSGSGILTHKDPTIISIIVGAVNVLVGFGLVFKVEVMRSIVNFFCFLNIAVGLLGLWEAVLLMPFFHLLGIVLILTQMLQIATSGLMIYLIGETDGAPNF